jgi:hypothetical protein
MLLPFVLSLRMPRGPAASLNPPKLLTHHLLHRLSRDEKTEQGSTVKELCVELAKMLKEARIGFVRSWFPWNFFDRRIGEERQFLMDTFVEAMRAADIEILAVLGNGYSRFLPEGLGLEHMQRYVDRLVPASAEIVRHYRGSIKMWQIENEPNWWKEHLAVSWRSGLIWLEPRVEEIMLRSLRDVVREENPEAKIIINVEADRQKANWKLYSDYCDVLGLDFYPAYSQPHRTSANALNLAMEVKAETGKPVIISETGYPSGPHLLGYNEERQKEYIRSACQVSYACDAINSLCIWRLSDTNWRSFPVQENHFGLFTKTRDPKPAWHEFVDQIKQHA